VEKLVKALLGKVPRGRPGRVPVEELNAIIEECKDASPSTLLGTLFEHARVGDSTRPGDAHESALNSLTDKFGVDLQEFLRNPSRVEFRDTRKSLSPQERQVVAILQRVARLQAVP
ncbi:MAG TPA: hypothetical protein VL359_19740, partial [bacterium]|nr:hypothetical protein [bacterium]